MKQRLFYEAPEAELLVVTFEENFLDSLTTNGSSFGENGNVKTQGNDTWDWDYSE